jgi:hypothetical protein
LAAGKSRHGGDLTMTAVDGLPQDGRSVVAWGPPRFVDGIVGGVVLLDVIATAAKRQRVCNDCMEASGFVAVDASPGLSLSQRSHRDRPISSQHPRHANTRRRSLSESWPADCANSPANMGSLGRSGTVAVRGQL